MTVLAGVLLVVAFLVWPARDPLTRASVSRAPVSRALGAGPATGPDGRATAGGATASTGDRLRRLLRRQVRLGRTRQRWAADFAELAAVGLDAGLPSAQAAVLACAVGATSRPEMRELAERLVEVEAQGAAVGECLARCADDDPELRFLAASWQLTDEFGVAAAPAARTAAGVLRERTAADERRTVLAAGPRASMWLLTLLPLSGPAVAVLLGLPVAEVYGGVAAVASTVTGLVLTGVGWLWSRRLLRRAVRPAHVR
ncbi:type II secretion system F family protein [Knoellia sp. CPCC 206450]|uniref:type II secretion system F family protein n=1 Tax=Knoellia tibetensis TaxID=3404798 RepID=UPI003B42A829